MKFLNKFRMRQPKLSWNQAVEIKPPNGDAMATLWQCLQVPLLGRYEDSCSNLALHNPHA